MQYIKISALALFALVAACNDDPTGLRVSEFEATMNGARTQELAGLSYATRVYSEAWPTGLYSIVMSEPQGSEGRVILMQCPDSAPLERGSYDLSADESGCRGIYRVIVTGPSGPEVRDEVISADGRLVVTEFSATTVAGTFTFTGGLRSGLDPIGSVIVSGNFNATRQN